MCYNMTTDYDRCQPAATEGGGGAGLLTCFSHVRGFTFHIIHVAELWGRQPVTGGRIRRTTFSSVSLLARGLGGANGTKRRCVSQNTTGCSTTSTTPR